MLSYMLPVEEKSPTSRNLSLNLNLTNNNNQINCINGGSSSSNGINNCINGTTASSAITTASTTSTTNYDSGNLINNILLSEKINNKLNTDNNIKNNIIDDGNILINNMTTGTMAPSTIQNKLINGTTAGELGNNGIIVTTGGTTDETSSRKIKMGKMSNTKNAPLKRVSFGSSKGSMVETLVFETPTPLPEHAEREFCFQPTDILAKTHNNSSFLQNGSCLDDSGIEMMQEELERSKVRVTFYQSSKPQQISPPPELQFSNNNNNFINFIDNNNLIIFGGGGGGGVGGCEEDENCFINNKELTKEDINLLKMSATTNGGPQILTTTTTTTTTTYDRQISTESGWDNPFRPGGDLSREADEIVNLIKGGKPITPTGDVNQIIGNGDANKKDTHVTENGTTVIDGVATKIDVSQTQSAINGTKSPQKGGGNNGLIKDGGNLAKNGVANNDGTTGAGSSPQTQTQISNQVIPGPQSASHVIIDDKKKKKCTCCVIQ